VIVPTGAWTEAGAGIRVRQSKAYAMNSVVLADPEHTLIVDPGVLPSELDDLARAAPESGAETLTLIFTHGDWDHVLGRPWWPRATTLAHDQFAAEVRHKSATILSEARAQAEREGETWERGFVPFAPDEAVSGLRFTKLGPWRVVFRDAFGHSPSMLTIHLPERRLLIAADLLSDIEIPMIEDSWQAYHRTLAELEPLAAHGAIETVIPGHGSIADGRDAVVARIERDLGYLDALERRVNEARSRGLDLQSTAAALADMDYLGKDAAYAMNEVHARNVAVVYREPKTAKAAKPARPKPSKPLGFSINGN
jgi:hydroxyacylglutathione hydrolase